MKILFLDDDHDRLKAAKRHFLGQELTLVETAKQAIDSIDSMPRFDLIHLDHDLGGIFLPSDEKSGYHVACHIANLPESKQPDNIIIHSYNPTGAKKMLEVLKGVCPTFYIPFDPDKPSVTIH